MSIHISLEPPTTHTKKRSRTLPPARAVLIYLIAKPFTAAFSNLTAPPITFQYYLSPKLLDRTVRAFDLHRTRHDTACRCVYRLRAGSRKVVVMVDFRSQRNKSRD